MIVSFFIGVLRKKSKSKRQIAKVKRAALFFFTEKGEAFRFPLLPFAF
jgi:hypothetical protein